MFRISDFGFRIFLLGCAFALAGCDNDPNPPTYHETRADGSPWAARYAFLVGDPKSFDPQFCYDVTGQRALEPVYDRLLEYHPMKTDPYELIPGMLAEIPTREDEPDGKVKRSSPPTRKSPKPSAIISPMSRPTRPR